MEQTADRVAIYGWDETARPQLEALERVAGLRAIAVGDRRPAALVRARTATGLPCYQHVLEMLRGAEYDAALINSAEGGAQAAQAAAPRAAALLLIGPQADASTLMEAAEAALRYRVPLTVLRPRLQQAGLAFTLRLAGADPGWRPQYLDIAMAGPAGALSLLRDAVAIAARLTTETPTQVVSSYFGDDEEDATAFVVQLRYADGRLTSLRTREAPETHLSLFADTNLGTLELRHAQAESTLAMAIRNGRRETSTLPDGDTLALEAERARTATGAIATDALFAPRESAILQAIELSSANGYVVSVQERSSRANLQLVESGTQAPTPRAGRVRLIGG